MEFHKGSPDYKSFEQAVAQGIDSHLEAIVFTQFPGLMGGGALWWKHDPCPSWCAVSWSLITTTRRALPAPSAQPSTLNWYEHHSL